MKFKEKFIKKQFQLKNNIEGVSNHEELAQQFDNDYNTQQGVLMRQEILVTTKEEIHKVYETTLKPLIELK